MLFKNNFKLENYIQLNIPKTQRSIMAQLRLGILPLSIETGRFNNIPSNERYCHFCKSLVEDEFHFICECSLYQNVRNNLLLYMYTKIPGFLILSEKEKFKCIMADDSRELHKYVIQAWDIRKYNLYNKSK